MTANAQPPQAGATPIPSATPTLGPMPTPAMDPLAEPVLPADPVQADYGSQVFWLYCSPCHGDHGQGLTDAFRQLYPPDHQNCWKSGCHGPRPYANGWTLPPSVPGLIGQERLAGFNTAADLYRFIRAAMPFEAPGSLDETSYWRVTAFLLRANGLWPGRETLGPDNAPRVRVGQAPAAPPASTAAASPVQGRVAWPTGVIIGTSLALAVFGLRGPKP